MSVPTNLEKLTPRNPGASPSSAFGASPSSRRIIRTKRHGSTQTPSLFSSEAAFGSSSSSAFGGSQEATPTFGRAEFGNTSSGGQPRGSRVAPFTPTEDEWWPGKLQSICGMTLPVYKCKSHEELRWEDYQWGDKGGPNHAGQSGVSVGPSASFAIPPPTFRTSPFGFTPAQTSTSGTTSHPSTPAFGSSIFRSSMPWGAQSQLVFRASSNPGSGSTTPAFGTTSTPAFVNYSTPPFGTTSTPAFGPTLTAAFGVTSCPIFGSGSTYPAFGSTPTAAFGATSSPIIGSGLTTPAFGTTSTPKFFNDSAPSFGATSTTALGSTPTAAFGATSSPLFGSGGAFGASSNAAFGASCSSSLSFGSSPAFGPSKTAFSSNQFGSGSYGAHTGSQVATSTVGRTEFGNSSSGGQPRGSRVAPFTPTEDEWLPCKLQSICGMTVPAYKYKTHEELRWEDYQWGDKGGTNHAGQSGVSVGPGASFAIPWPTCCQSSPFSSTSASNAFSSAAASATTSNPLLLSTTPSIAKTSSAFSQTTSPFGQTSTPTFAQVHTFNTASSRSGGSLFPSTPSPVLSTNAAAIHQTNRSFSLPFQTSEAAETSGVSSLGDLGQTRPAGTGGFGSQNDFGRSHCGQSSINGSSSVVQPALVTNASGTLPAVQQLSIGCTQTGSSVQYGIYSMPVPFSRDGDNTPSKPEADAQVIPRGEKRSLVIGPEYCPAREQKPSPPNRTSPCANDGVPKDGTLEKQTDFVKASQKMNGVHDDCSLQNDKEFVIIKGAGESAIGYGCGAGIEALMPKLCQPDYYTEPHVKELAAKERAEPGFCCRVKDFVVGRLGYGHIKFVGETDVRGLDLESLVRFNNREVIVCKDESKKPPIGQGPNIPAEVTLLNIKCIDKKTGKQYIEGPKVEKYKEMLKKAAEEQGAEFVSYDPINGEWKFKVRHFS